MNAIMSMKQIRVSLERGPVPGPQFPDPHYSGPRDPGLAGDRVIIIVLDSDINIVHLLLFASESSPLNDSQMGYGTDSY